MESLHNFDPEVATMGLTKRAIIDSLTIDDVKAFLESLGITNIEDYSDRGLLICPTVCHHDNEEDASMKLYWYQNYKVFNCYTECGTMSIFKFYQHFMEVRGQQTTDDDAIHYIGSCLKNLILSPRKYKRKGYDLEKYVYTSNLPELKTYSPEILTYFTNYHHPTWLNDGISNESMDKFHIGFLPLQNKIVIPHFDMRGELIGIRGRAINQEDIENGGKYMPIKIGDTLYNHPLHFNLYGIYEHQDGIRARRCAIISEGEKSTLLDDTYYGPFSNTVACCGSKINKYQIGLLTKQLGVQEIVIAFDKEYENSNSEKAHKYRKKIESMCQPYKHQAVFSYIWDYENLLEEKDAPFDKGKDIFEYLYKNRISMR